MKFSEFNAVLQSHVAKMTANAKSLYTVDTDKDTMWNLYLDSFPKGTNEVYRQRREFDCSCCRHFVKAFGNVVSIVNNKVISIWDFEVADTKYQTVINALSAYVKSYRINDAFVTKENFYGTEKNYEKDDSGNVTTWEHFYVKLPEALVSTSSDSVASITGSIRDTRNLFKRSLEEITQDSIETVQELTAQGSLYKGDEWVSTLKEFLRLHKEYHKLSTEEKENFCWEKSIDVGGTIRKIRNHSMGKLLTDISENKDLDASVKSWEAMVAPTNYKRLMLKLFIQNVCEKTLRKLLLNWV